MLTAKARVLRAVGAALLPLSTPEIVCATGLDRRDVWHALVYLHRTGVVRRVNGRRVYSGRFRSRVTRWRLARRP